MKVLIAPDKFRGSLTAAEAAAAMAEGVARYNPGWEVVKAPVGDGGEGTAAILTAAAGGSMVRTQAPDPLLRYVSCQYGVSADGSTAFIDMAEASGLQRLQPQEVNAFKTSSIGTGHLIYHALRNKCTKVILCMGGTATIDCGMGIAHALGVTFEGELNQQLAPIGGHLGKVEFIHGNHRVPQLKHTQFIVLADVAGPLLGDGGVLLYARQKGVPEAELPVLERNVEHFANLMEARFGTIAKTPGMGAAGGAALACMGLLGAKLAMGADFVLDALQLPGAIDAADLVMVGEGQLDVQSLQGKAAIAVARQAQLQGKPVLAVCGRIRLGLEEQLREGITLSGALAGGEDGMPGDSYKELVLRTEELLRELGPKIEKG